MSRFLTSVAILIALTVLSVVSLRMIRHECREYTSLTEEINAAFSAGDGIIFITSRGCSWTAASSTRSTATSRRCVRCWSRVIRMCMQNWRASGC